MDFKKLRVNTDERVSRRLENSFIPKSREEGEENCVLN